MKTYRSLRNKKNPLNVLNTFSHLEPLQALLSTCLLFGSVVLSPVSKKKSHHLSWDESHHVAEILILGRELSVLV